ncbi:MDR family MFS transporter [Adlercreutzia sp. R7]|uniref:MDR family MFS transporter n=1 Tax=Adlercreutzia wanghongyangiae TaxID=3111451 RepID=A0ABU6IKA8_9ACTN|nr:MDR family MFS transporter [Adlercreutzia sp. R7]
MGLTGEQLRMVSVLLAGALIAVLNQTLLSPALPVIMDDFRVDATTVQWLTSGYALVEAIVIPLSAYLMGRFTTRQLFIGGMVLFFAGTMLSAFAPIFVLLLLGRMLQAAATGFVMPMVFSIIVLVFPREHRGSAMGLVSLIIGFAPAVGPSLSGVMVETVGWRALFVIVALFTAAVIVGAVVALRDTFAFERAGFDKLSVVLSSLGLLALLYGLSSIASTRTPWIQVGLMLLGLVLMALFVRRQLKLPTPFLRIQVLATREFRVSVIVIGAFQAVLVGSGVLLPIMLQNVLAATPLQTGLIMLPGAILGATTALMAGRLFDKLGARRLVLPGVFLAMAGGIGMIMFSTGTTLVFVACVYTVLMVGLEFTMTPVSTWGLNALTNNVIQHANATSNTLNQICASLGTAILVSLSALSSSLYPSLSSLEQQMAGIHIAFTFAAVILAAVFVLAVFAVRDRGLEPSAQADYVMEAMPTEAGTVIKVGAVMRRDPYYVGQDAQVSKVFRLMIQHKTSGLPVVDDQMRVVGFVSDGDIMKYIGRNDATVLDTTRMLYQAADDEDFAQRVVSLMSLPVRNIATLRAISVRVDTALEEACRLLAERRIKKVPVVSDGKLVGSLSRSDIIRSTMENLTAIEQMARSEDIEGSRA